MYAKGICKNCYLSGYHKHKRHAKKVEKQRIKAEKALLSGKKQRARKSKTPTMDSNEASTSGRTDF
jgi:hypothetical protein